MTKTNSCDKVLSVLLVTPSHRMEIEPGRGGTPKRRGSQFVHWSAMPPDRPVSDQQWLPIFIDNADEERASSSCGIKAFTFMHLASPDPSGRNAGLSEAVSQKLRAH